MTRRKRQAELPGCEREAIPAVDEAVASYTSVMYERRDLQTREGEARQALMDTMKEHKLTFYRYVDGEAEYEVNYEESAKIRCKRTKYEDSEWEEVTE